MYIREGKIFDRWAAREEWRERKILGLLAAVIVQFGGNNILPRNKKDYSENVTVHVYFN